ncbi:MAG: hypothetical protein ABJA57_01940 [Ginsengibacter sp.]
MLLGERAMVNLPAGRQVVNGQCDKVVSYVLFHFNTARPGFLFNISLGNFNQAPHVTAFIN